MPARVRNDPAAGDGLRKDENQKIEKPEQA
jgi:hypothetical protein